MIKTLLGFLSLVVLAFSSPVMAQAGPVIVTASGPVSGTTEGQISNFKAIPFAAPPVGPLRWAPPVPVSAWTEPRDATGYGPICRQAARPDGVPAAGGGRSQSEDCLTLNVWTPAAARKAPVMVWVHGGAFRFGSGTGPVYDGTAFAQNGVVLVTLNYRLGAFGFFAHPLLTAASKPGEPIGNYGLMDQLAALAWVKANIARFGGDPADVTVFGESAGASSILSLLSTPAARGLFSKAIIESGGGWQVPGSLAEQEKKGVELATGAGLASPTLEELRAIPADKLLVSGGGIGSLAPFIDGRLITQSPARAFATGTAIDVPMIIGSNSFEASLMKAFPVATDQALARMTPRQRALYTKGVTDEVAVRDAYTDLVMGAPARWIAARSSTGAPTYLYHFSYVASGMRDRVPGASHGSEIIYVFKTGSKIAGRLASDQDRAMETLVHSCWVSFATTGKPACGPTAWPAYRPKEDQLMEFGVSSGLRKNFRKPYYDADDAALDDN